MNKPAYLKFIEVQSTHRLTRIVDVRSVKHNQSLGTIKWHGAWRQYVWSPAAGAIFNPDCMIEIATTTAEMTRQHREALRARAQSR